MILQACAPNPDKAKHLSLQRGSDFYARGRYADAEIQFRKALQQDARFGEAWLWLGRTEERLGSYTPAFEDFRKAVALMPGQDGPEIALGNFLLVAWLGNPAHPAGLHDQISAIADQLLTRNRNSFDGLRLKGYLTLADKNPAGAVEFFEKADRSKPNQPDVATALSQSLMQAGRKDEAERVALDFLKKTPSYGPLYTMLYQYYLQSGRTADAEAMLKSKVSHNPHESLFRIELARHYARAGRTGESSEVLNQLLSEPKIFPRGQADVGDFYMESHDWASARQHYDQGAQSDGPLKVMYWKRLAQVDFATNDIRGARQMLERIVKAQPDDSESLVSLAALQVAGNDPAERKLALSEFSTLVDKAPNRVDYRYRYADALRLDGQDEAARAQYLMVVQRQPENLAALGTLADLSIRTRHFDEAMGYADRVLTLQPWEPRAVLIRSAALAAKGRFPETHTLLTELARQHPELREAKFQLALLDIEQKHYQEAEARLRKLYTPGKGDIQSLKGMVELYRARNQLDKAVSLLRQDLEKGADSNEVRTLLARTAAQAGNRDIASVEYEKLARTQPHSPEIAIELGLIRQAQGNLGGAVAEFERGRELAPRSSLVYAYLGKAEDEQGKTSDAMASYRKSLSLDSRNPWVMNNLAYLLADTGGDLQEAMTMAQSAAHDDPGNPAFGDTIGWIYLKKKDFPSAVQAFSGLRDKLPGDVGLRIHLTQALLASGDRNQARSEVQAALALPSTPAERTTLDKLQKELTK